MKQNTLYLFSLLASFSLLNANASDYVRPEEYADIFHRPEKTVMKRKPNATRSILPESTPSHKPTVNMDTEASNYLKNCALDFLRKRKASSFDDTILEFYQTDSFFQILAVDTSLDEKMRDCRRFQYHCEAALFYINSGNFEDAQSNLLKASEIDSWKVRFYLGRIMQKQVSYLKDETSLQRFKETCGTEFDSKSLLFCAELYETIRNQQHDHPLDNIDYIALCVLTGWGDDYKKSILYGFEALSMNTDWPKTCNPLYIIHSSPDQIKHAIALALYELNDYTRAKIMYGLLPVNILTLEHYCMLASMSALQEKWQESLDYFKICTQLSNARSSAGLESRFYYSLRDKEVFALMDMLMNISEHDFNKYAATFITLIKNSLPSLSNHVKKLYELLRERKRTEVRRLALTAIAQSKITRVEELYKKFEKDYMNIWDQCSGLSSQEPLNHVNETAKSIEELYRQLKSTAKVGTYVDSFEEITELYKNFQYKLALYSRQIVKIKHEITKLKRPLMQSLRVDQKSEMSINSPTQTQKSLTAETKAELKQKEEEERNKENTALMRKEERRKKRESLTQTYNDKTIVSNPLDAEPNNLISQPSRLISFKDNWLKSIWETRDEEFSDILDMLDAINQADSMFELRGLLKPGAKLKILDEDREGQISLRTNDQYRICFYWVTGKGAYDLEWVDYH